MLKFRQKVYLMYSFFSVSLLNVSSGNPIAPQKELCKKWTLLKKLEGYRDYSLIRGALIQSCSLPDLNSYYLHWNFDWKSCFVVFFLEWNEWKNPQLNFSCQNLSLERNFFKWDGKVTKIWHLLFHRIWNFFFSIHNVCS